MCKILPWMVGSLGTVETRVLGSLRSFQAEKVKGQGLGIHLRSLNHLIPKCRLDVPRTLLLFDGECQDFISTSETFLLLLSSLRRKGPLNFAQTRKRNFGISERLYRSID